MTNIKGYSIKMKNKETNETLPPMENFKSLLSKALTRESDPSKVKIVAIYYINPK